MCKSEVKILGILGIPEVRCGDNVGALVGEALIGNSVQIFPGDILVLAHKIVSKAEGQVVPLNKVVPSALARAWAQKWDRDPRLVEVVLSESQRIIKMDRGCLIAQTRHGFVCANAGVDLSNTPEGTAILLPVDPDQSAKSVRHCLRKKFEVDVAVIITDTFGRPWREGLVNVAIGVAGMLPLKDYQGTMDWYGRTLQATAIARADEIASAAELVMGKLRRIPAALVRGVALESGPGAGTSLVRSSNRDLFR